MAEELQARLQQLALSPEEFVGALPAPVRQRLDALQQLQEQHDDLEEQYHKEKAELDAKYAKLYAPLYDERAAITSGAKEPAAAEGTAAAAAEPGGPPGVPGFWQTILLRCEPMRAQMNEKDPDVLRYLKDVRAEALTSESGANSGFRLTFTWDAAANPYFTNETLTKEYHMLQEGPEPVLEKAEGCTINWKPGKNVTVKVMKKKPKKGARPDAKPLTKTEPVESFFNFFSPPAIPEDDGEGLDEEEVEALHEEIEEDFEIGAILREKVIPNAVNWYTGEALEEEGMLDYDDEDEDEGDEDEDEDEDEDDEDEEEDEEEEEEEQQRPKKGGKKGGKKGKGGAAGEQPQECKQQ